MCGCATIVLRQIAAGILLLECLLSQPTRLTGEAAAGAFCVVQNLCAFRNKEQLTKRSQSMRAFEWELVIRLLVGRSDT